MPSLVRLSALDLFAAPLVAASAPKGQPRPNLLVNYADDQSYRSVGACPGSYPWVETPHIDRLAPPRDRGDAGEEKALAELRRIRAPFADALPEATTEAGGR